MLLFPASSASSTYASCKDQGIGSVVLAHDEVALGVEAAGRTVDAAVGEVDGDAASGGVGRGAGEELQDVVGLELGVDLDGGEEGIQHVVGARFLTADELERGGFEL